LILTQSMHIFLHFWFCNHCLSKTINAQSKKHFDTSYHIPFVGPIRGVRVARSGTGGTNDIDKIPPGPSRHVTTRYLCRTFSDTNFHTFLFYYFILWLLCIINICTAASCTRLRLTAINNEIWWWRRWWYLAQKKVVTWRDVTGRVEFWLIYIDCTGHEFQQNDPLNAADGKLWLSDERYRRKTTIACSASLSCRVGTSWWNLVLK